MFVLFFTLITKKVQSGGCTFFYSAREKVFLQGFFNAIFQQKCIFRAKRERFLSQNKNLFFYFNVIIQTNKLACNAFLRRISTNGCYSLLENNKSGSDTKIYFCKLCNKFYKILKSIYFPIHFLYHRLCRRIFFLCLRGRTLPRDWYMHNMHLDFAR